MAVCEAPIDALSLAAVEGIRTDTVYVSTGGGMGPETIVALKDLAVSLKSHDCGRMTIATDADKAGERYAERLLAVADAAKLSVERVLPDIYKDWNALLQGRVVRRGL